MNIPIDKPLSVINCNQIYYLRGGSEKYMFELEDLLNRYGNTCIPFAAKHSKNRPSEYSRYFPTGIDLESPKLSSIPSSFYNFDAKRKMELLIREMNPDIAHLHLIHSRLSVSFLRALQKKSVKVVQTLHDYKFLCPISTFFRDGKQCEVCPQSGVFNVLRNRCNRGSYARSAFSLAETLFNRLLNQIEHVDLLISPSKYLREKFIEYGIDSKKIINIPNFISHIEKNITPPSDYFLYFGRLEESKGVWDLVKVFERMKDVKLKIAGTGPLVKQLEQYIQDKSLGNIELLGFIENSTMPQLIKSAYMTISPSRWPENYPYSILESLACGTPIIGSNKGGIPEMAIEGKTGHVFQAGNLEQLESIVKSCIADTSKNMMQRIESLAFANTLNADNHYKKIREAYESVL